VIPHSTPGEAPAGCLQSLPRASTRLGARGSGRVGGDSTLGGPQVETSNAQPWMRLVLWLGLLAAAAPSAGCGTGTPPLVEMWLGAAVHITQPKTNIKIHS